MAVTSKTAIKDSKWSMNHNGSTLKMRSSLTREKYSVVDIGIGELCSPQNVFRKNMQWCCCSNGIQLFKYTDAPEYLHGNPFVVGGYRVQLSTMHCIRSMFAWTNDTVNIWTHFIGFCIFLFYMIHDNLYQLPYSEGYLLDHIFVTLGLGCYQFCLLASTGYHVFRCQSEEAQSRWLALDLAGISVGLLGCYLPGIHYAFYCLSFIRFHSLHITFCKVWRDIYLMIIVILFGAVLFYQTRPRYYSRRWYRARVALYVSLTAYGLVPVIHWVYLNGGVDAPLVQVFAPKVVVVYLLGAIAALFYVTKFPERWFPGKFDYVGASHQCWHVMVVIIFLWWHRCGQQLFYYRLENPCQ